MDTGLAVIYVDSLVTYPKRPFGYSQWCHMFTDGDLEELHAFANRIGLHRRWFQKHHIKCHYDLTSSKRAVALLYGAKEINLRDWLSGKK